MGLIELEQRQVALEYGPFRLDFVGAVEEIGTEPLGVTHEGEIVTACDGARCLVESGSIVNTETGESALLEQGTYVLSEYGFWLEDVEEA